MDLTDKKRLMREHRCTKVVDYQYKHPYGSIYCGNPAKAREPKDKHDKLWLCDHHEHLRQEFIKKHMGKEDTPTDDCSEVDRRRFILSVIQKNEIAMTFKEWCGYQIMRQQVYSAMGIGYLR